MYIWTYNNLILIIYYTYRKMECLNNIAYNKVARILQYKHKFYVFQ